MFLCKKKNKEKVSLKELRELFYKNRDFEISNLWQRSVFLSAFLILSFTGYGYLILQIIDTIDSKENTLPYLHLLAIALGLINLIFSVLWIMMAKGSKAWYEVYEEAIRVIEEEEALEIENKYQMGEQRLPDGLEYNSSIFSTSAGGYSVSRINIAIGQICLLIWFVIIGFHLYLYYSIDDNTKPVSFDKVAILLVVIFVIFRYLSNKGNKKEERWVRSSFNFNNKK